jgi:hypothetical protein
MMTNVEGDIMKDVMIDVAKDFSDDPFGRYADDGKFNAGAFRDNILIPELKKAIEDGDTKITIDFSGVPVGLGSSFIEEVFGGLIRSGFNPSQINDIIVYKFPLPFYMIQAKKFMAIEWDKRKSDK